MIMLLICMINYERFFKTVSPAYLVLKRSNCPEIFRLTQVENALRLKNKNLVLFAVVLLYIVILDLECVLLYFPFKQVTHYQIFKMADL